MGHGLLLKKTLVVVGALMAATMFLPDAADAAPHHHAYFQRVRLGARAPLRPRFAAYRPRHAALRVAAGPDYRSRFVRGRFGRGYSMRHPLARRAVAWQRPLLRRRFVSASAAAQVVPTVAAPILGAATSLLTGTPAVVATPRASMRAAGGAQTGQASFYGLHSRTANGGRVGSATCAHRSLPFGTRVLVTNLANARQAVLTVNDRGPFVRGRIVDVSVGAAGALGMLHSGTAPVRVQVVGGPG